MMKNIKKGTKIRITNLMEVCPPSHTVRHLTGAGISAAVHHLHITTKLMIYED
jgi:hypothetical protein